MYKLVLILLFLNILSIGQSSEYIERLGIVKENSFITKKASNNSEKLLNLRKNETVIICGEEGNYYKIKLNNYSYGYVAKKNIELKNVIKEEKYVYSLKKLKYNIKHILDRFNEKIINTDYYKINGNIPHLTLNRCYIEKQNLIVELIYSCNNKNKKNTVINNNEISNIMNQLIEVIFYKMIEISMISYRIDIMIKDSRYDNLFTDYIVYRYKPSGKTTGTLDGLEKEFKRNLQMSRKTKEIFKECP
jgi:hypothetical protein